MLKEIPRQTLVHFHPERIVWIGSLLLTAFCIFLFLTLWKIEKMEPPPLFEKQLIYSNPEPYTFSLSLDPSSYGFSIPDLQGKMTFSLDPPRPDGSVQHQRLLVRLKQSGESQRVALPCRIDLEHQGDELHFAKESSLFWIELNSLGDGKMEARVWISSPEGEKMEAGHFLFTGQDCPLQNPQEFPEGSPLRLLAEAKWWGQDLFRGSYESSERIELSELLELREGDFLVWKEGKWQKSLTLDRDVPIARIQSVSPKLLVLEGWDQNGHTRIGLGLNSGPPFKMKGEDLFSSIRVRSEKQISCTIEKQCMVLKIGDWVLKTAGRWKILRKKEERDAFLNGKLFGDLFILEQISQKQGQKMIQGRLFNPGRTQVVSIEMQAQGRKSRRKP